MTAKVAKGVPQTIPTSQKVESKVKEDEVEDEIEEEVEPDEADRAEIEAAKAIEASAEPPDTEEEPEEIAGLRAAFQKVEDRIQWHKDQIESSRQEVTNHEQQIADLRGMVQNKFKNLTGTTVEKRSPGRPKGSGSPKKQGAKTRTSYGDGNSTGDLIASCLKRAKKPVNTKHIIDFLKEGGNDTNPSVELSRMVGKGLVVRPARGLYEWIGGE